MNLKYKKIVEKVKGKKRTINIKIDVYFAVY
jgi:hypothetical protein